jgi:hypothetical protein
MRNDERRESDRVQCFIVDELRQQVPVWVFRPEAESGATLALAVDLSPEGIQLLVDPGAAVDAAHDCVRILASPELDFDGALLRASFLWRNDHQGLFSRVGFSFERADAEAIGELCRRLGEAVSTGRTVWLRCTISRHAKVD